MPLFNCLSQNVSQILEKEKKSGWKERLNFKRKKRRSVAQSANLKRAPLTPCNKRMHGKENAHPGQMEACTEPFSNNFTSLGASCRGTPAKRVPPCSLPPMPPTHGADFGGASIYIKELDTSEMDAPTKDYMPLSSVGAFQAADEEDSYLSEFSDVILPLHESQRVNLDPGARRPQYKAADSFSGTAAGIYYPTSHLRCLNDVPASLPPRRFPRVAERGSVSSMESGGSARTSLNSLTRSTGCFNKAFIQSSGSLPSRTVSGVSSIGTNALGNISECDSRVCDNNDLNGAGENKANTGVYVHPQHARLRGNKFCLQSEDSFSEINHCDNRLRLTADLDNEDEHCRSTHHYESIDYSVIEGCCGRDSCSSRLAHGVVAMDTGSPDLGHSGRVSDGTGCDHGLSALDDTSLGYLKLDIVSLNDSVPGQDEAPRRTRVCRCGTKNCGKSKSVANNRARQNTNDFIVSRREWREGDGCSFGEETVPCSRSEKEDVASSSDDGSIDVVTCSDIDVTLGTVTCEPTACSVDDDSADNSHEENADSSMRSGHNVSIDSVMFDDDRSIVDGKLSSAHDVSVNSTSLPSDRASEFLGCMSFGVPHLLKKEVDGRYYLLTEEVGRKKHLQQHAKTKAVLGSDNYQNIPKINQALEGHKFTVGIPRGKGGFGFTFCSEIPPRIGRVDRASPAEQAGIRTGDAVIHVNNKNVSRSSWSGVTRMVKKSNPPVLTMELLRDHEVTSHENDPADPQALRRRGIGTSTDHVYESIREKSKGEHHKENREAGGVGYEEAYLMEEDDDEEEMVYSQQRRSNQPAITSTPRPPLLNGKQMMVCTGQMAPQIRDRQEAIHRLMSVEYQYIDFMHYGIERYSRPLRHCIISARQHALVFQNVEKLVTISEYNIKQMQDNASSACSDTDDSQSSESSSFPNSVALTYQSKIQMLCQAHEVYAQGLAKSNNMLRELQKNRDFMNFIKEPEPSLGGPFMGHPSITAFINKPVQHVEELYTALCDIYTNTPLESPDFSILQQVVNRLSHCLTYIANLSSAHRVQSLESVASGKTSSSKGSMASLASTGSSTDSDAHRLMLPPASTSIRSTDSEVKRIQDRLIFSPNVPIFNLCQEERHLIFKGDIFRNGKGSWFKSQLLLFSDLLLVADLEVDGSLRVSENPVLLKSLTGIEINRKDASEFILYTHAPGSSTLPRSQKSSSSSSSSSSSRGSTKTLTLRAPSSQEKFMWKSLLEQRASTVTGGHLQHYGSMRDISNTKTSVVL